MEKDIQLGGKAYPFSVGDIVLYDTGESKVLCEVISIDRDDNEFPYLISFGENGTKETNSHQLSLLDSSFGTGVADDVVKKHWRDYVTWAKEEELSYSIPNTSFPSCLYSKSCPNLKDCYVVKSALQDYNYRRSSNKESV